MAAKSFADPDVVIEEGFRALAIHQLNDTADGPEPKRLQLLWWEFPPEHWTSLREGSKMNFVSTPPSIVHPNANMDAEQLEVAAAFVDELLDLAVLRRPTDGSEVLLNAPLFVVPK